MSAGFQRGQIRRSNQHEFKWPLINVLCDLIKIAYHDTALKK